MSMRNNPWNDTTPMPDPKSAPAAAPASTADLDMADRHRAHRPLSASLALAVAPEMRVPAVLGFGGWAQSGKDAAAEFVIARHGHRLLSFGTYVNALLLDVNGGVEVEPGRFERARDLYERLGYEGAKKIDDYRIQLQDLGTGINKRDSGLWGRLVLADLPPGERGVITGLRSKPQIDAVRAVGGLTIWVDRPGAAPANGHENETQVGPDDFDVVLDNSGTLGDLRISIERVLAEHA